MELCMYCNEILVDTVYLDAERISQPGYLGQKKRYLINLHKSTTGEQPEPLFYIHQEMASPVNHVNNGRW